MRGIFTGRNEVVAKVIFLHPAVILFTGGEGGLCQGEPHPPPPAGSRLQHTINERPVRILLECILVCDCSLRGSLLQVLSTRCYVV